jgi:hypothetical protein
MPELVAGLRDSVKTIQRLSGHAQDMLSPKSQFGGGTKVISLADVMSQLLAIEAAATEARLAIETAAKAAGARERKGRG